MTSYLLNSLELLYTVSIFSHTFPRWIKNESLENSLEVQQLGLGAIIAQGKVLVLGFSPHKLLSATTPHLAKGAGDTWDRNPEESYYQSEDLFFLLW